MLEIGESGNEKLFSNLAEPRKFYRSIDEMDLPEFSSRELLDIVFGSKEMNEFLKEWLECPKK